VDVSEKKKLTAVINNFLTAHGNAVREELCKSFELTRKPRVLRNETYKIIKT